MNIPINFHLHYIVDENGVKISVVLSIDEYNILMKYCTNDLSHLEDEITKGINSPILEQSHKEIFEELQIDSMKSTKFLK